MVLSCILMIGTATCASFCLCTGGTASIHNVMVISAGSVTLRTVWTWHVAARLSSRARFSREWDRRRPSRLLPCSYFVYFGSRRIYCSRQDYIHIFKARMPALFCLPNIPSVANYIQGGHSCLEDVNVQCAYIYIYALSQQRSITVSVHSHSIITKIHGQPP